MTKAIKTPSHNQKESVKRFGCFKIQYAAVLASLLINTGLFGIMPVLIKNVPEKQNHPIDMQPIEILRPPLSEPFKKKEAPEKKIMVKKQAPETIMPPRPELLKTALTLSPVPQIDHTLPEIPQGTLEAIPMKAFAMKGVFGPQEIDTPLRPIAKIPPLYPMRAKRMGINGWVKVKCIVETDGSVSNITIVKASPLGYFEKSVINSVKKWQFQPGTIEGVRVRTFVITTIRFELEG